MRTLSEPLKTLSKNLVGNCVRTLLDLVGNFDPTTDVMSSSRLARSMELVVVARWMSLIKVLGRMSKFRCSWFTAVLYAPS